MSSAEAEAEFKQLSDALLSVPATKFDAFDITRATYESAGSKIGADILIPKRAFSGPSRPVLVRIHGGFLITGASLFPAWFSKWILDFAEVHGAVIISPDYRLLPEVKGVDILKDLENFWGWVQGGGPQRHLESIGRSDVVLDPGRLLLTGESAGGYLALQSGLSRFVRPRAIVTLYPMIDLRSDYYTKVFEKSVAGVSNFPNKVVDEFLANKSDTGISEASPPTRLDLAIATVQNGRFLEFIGDEPVLFPLDRIENGILPTKPAGESLLPPLVILHGDSDSAVPVEGSLKFVKLLREKDPEAKVHMVVQPGEHGFDATSTLDDEWLAAELRFIEAEWLSKSRSRM